MPIITILSAIKTFFEKKVQKMKISYCIILEVPEADCLFIMLPRKPPYLSKDQSGGTLFRGHKGSEVWLYKPKQRPLQHPCFSTSISSWKTNDSHRALKLHYHIVNTEID